VVDYFTFNNSAW